MKELVRSAVAGGCRLGFLLARREARLLSGLTILCYHRVLPAGEKSAYFIPDLVVTPEAFEAHCAALSRHYRVLPLREAFNAWSDRTPTDKPIAVITFDDGYRDNYILAAPILRKHGLWATFFVVADLAGTDAPPWYDQAGRAVQVLRSQGRSVALDGTVLESSAPSVSPRDVVAEAKKRAPRDRAALTARLVAAAGDALTFSENDRIMTWDQLQAMHKEGHEIGPHSASHEILPLLDDDALRAEVCGSKQTLETGLGAKVTTFCYPNGDYDARTLRLAEEAGYQCAVTTRRGPNMQPGQAPYELKRWFIHEGRLAGPRGAPSQSQLRLELSGLADEVFRREASQAITL